RSGSKIRSFGLGFGPSCPPVRNRQFYYLAEPDKRLRVYQASDLVELFNATADDDSAIISVTAQDDFIIFGTNTGLVTAMHSDRAVKIWDFKAAQGINPGLIRDSGIVYFSSGDTHVYALNENTGRLIWKYRTDALLRNAPVVTRRFVYQNVDGQGLIALDKRTGRMMWKISEGLALLAESSKGAYVLGKNSELIFVDAVNWEQADSVLLPKISLYISNIDDSRIYLADDLGRVVCLESIN
ncbi:MAG: PQQ-binding-like beta-propeller repeat protein, partial [Phycisphaerae bacterium]